jgi:hypothetical protein
VLLLIETELNLISVDPQIALVKQHQINSVANIIYDQFGPVAVYQTATFDAILTDRPILHNKIDNDVVFLIAAFQQVHVQIFDRSTDHAVCLAFQGIDQTQSQFMDFWKGVISTDSCIFWVECQQVKTTCSSLHRLHM